MEANNQDKMVLQQFLSGVWWLVLLRGIAVGILGCLLLTRPAITVLVIVQFMGIYWLVDGIFTLARSIRGRKTHKNWGWGIFVGVLGMLAGLVVLSRPLASAILTQLFLVYFLGITAIVSGITSIITGFRLRKEVRGEWSMFFGGLIWAIFGILLLTSPLMSAVVLIWIAGIIAVVGGIIMIIFGFRLRSLAKGIVVTEGEQLAAT
jgi:uncharacterized membrane protein HdeD (DUF308 family)